MSTTTHTQAENPWVDYQPNCSRDKRFYDIKLRNGAIVICCWPNGTGFYPMDPDRDQHPIPKEAGKPPYRDYRVVQIRLTAGWVNEKDDETPKMVDGLN